VIGNTERKNRLEAGILARIRFPIHLQEMCVRFALDFDQIRKLRDLGDATESLAYAFAIRERQRHDCSLIRLASAPWERG